MSLYELLKKKLNREKLFDPLKDYEEVQLNEYKQDHSKKINEKQVDLNKETKNYFNELYPSYTEMISDIIIYVILVCNILTILFFTLVKDIEGNIVKQQINYLLDDVFSNIKYEDNVNDEENINGGENINDGENINEDDILKKIKELTTSDFSDKNSLQTKNNERNIVKKIKQYLTNLNITLKSKLTQIQPEETTETKIKENNQEIFNKSMIILSIINVICIILLIGLWFYNKYDYIYYLKKNIILSIFVIITELIFLYVISNKYMYIDKKYVLMETLKKINKQ